ncbi:Spy/CpxP family protein refolding chaperone [Pantanalinema sp. GBBB05]|uniref:Spy/CpxP family protein refolding chaperone n=1 Tax=Pantanalinema sp. GBBB05 TaxID=2604139 RepID=UPI001DF1D5ED|nr:hypothetical protein [Pantanalinema sp. GBBB05]
MQGRCLILFPLAGLLVHVGSTIAMAQSRSITPAVSAMESDQAAQIPVPPWARDLQLNAEQRSQLQAIQQQALQKRERLHQQLLEAETQLRSRLHSQASIQELRQHYQTVQALRQQLADNHFDALLAERQVLTSNQLATLIQRLCQPPIAP